MKKVNGLKVVSYAITRYDIDGGDAGGNEEKDQSKAVANKLLRMSTSRIHRFKPECEPRRAFDALATYGNVNAKIVFSNKSSLAIRLGKYEAFDDQEQDEKTVSISGTMEKIDDVDGEEVFEELEELEEEVWT